MGYIYKITNLINQKSYIGLTHRTPELRWKEHIDIAYGEKSRRHHLHNAILKYGIENFEFKILEEVSEDELNNREKYWIKYYDTYDNGYNETYGGEGAIKYDYNNFLTMWNEGFTVNEIAEKHGCSRNTVYYALSKIEGWKEEALLRREENNRKALNISRSNLIEVYDLDGNFISSYNSQREASIALFGDNSNEANICRTIKKGKGRVGNYQFRLAGEEKPGKYKRTGSRPVSQYDLSGNFIKTYRSCQEAALALKGDSKYGSYIGQVAKQDSKRKTAYGFQWRFENEITNN